MILSNVLVFRLPLGEALKVGLDPPQCACFLLLGEAMKVCGVRHSILHSICGCFSERARALTFLFVAAIAILDAAPQRLPSHPFQQQLVACSINAGPARCLFWFHAATLFPSPRCLSVCPAQLTPHDPLCLHSACTADGSTPAADVMVECLPF